MLKAALHKVAASPLGASVDARIAALQAKLHQAQAAEKKARDDAVQLQAEVKRLGDTVAEADFNVEKSANELYRARDRFNATEQRAREAEARIAALEKQLQAAATSQAQGGQGGSKGSAELQAALEEQQGLAETVRGEGGGGGGGGVDGGFFTRGRL